LTVWPPEVVLYCVYTSEGSPVRVHAGVEVVAHRRSLPPPRSSHQHPYTQVQGSVWEFRFYTGGCSRIDPSPVEPSRQTVMTDDTTSIQKMILVMIC